MSPLLLENSNRSTTTPLQSSQNIPRHHLEVSSTSIQFSTPKAKKDMYLQIRTLATVSHDQLPTQRLLFRKIVKGIDEKDYKLGKANMRIKELEERLEQLRPKKKGKSELVQIPSLSQHVLFEKLKSQLKIVKLYR